jgi:hypothetical protein
LILRALRLGKAFGTFAQTMAESPETVMMSKSPNARSVKSSTRSSPLPTQQPEQTSSLGKRLIESAKEARKIASLAVCGNVEHLG